MSNLPPPSDPFTPDEPKDPPAAPAPRRLDPTLPLPTELMENFGVTGRAQAPNQIDPPSVRASDAQTAWTPGVASVPPANLRTPPSPPTPAPAAPPATPPQPAAPPVRALPPVNPAPSWQAPASVPPAPPTPSRQAQPPASVPPALPAPVVAPRQPPAPPRQGPPPALPAGGGTPILVQLGEVKVSSSTIHTPAGNIPLKGSHWTVTDQWHAQSKIPVWAVVCAVVLFFVLCFLSLFFLLARQTRYTGTVQITITNGQQQYVVRIPVADQRTVQYVNTQVNYVRSLAAL